MIKVLIVDDEPKLREGLKSIVPWAELGYEVVDAAANGNEALEKHQQHAPDVMLVDIRMPGMDGLQLIEAVRSVDPAIHLLILSGYADFDYAKQAISHRVDGYLLKPVDEEELTSYLVQMGEAIRQERERKALNQAAADLSREQLIQSWIHQDGTDSASRPLAERQGLAWDRYQVALIQVHSPDQSSHEPDRLFLNHLKECFEGEAHAAVFSIHRFVGLLLPVPVSSAAGRKELQERIEKAADLSGAIVTSALGHPVHEIAGIAASYGAARTLLRRSFFYPPGELLYPELVPFGGEAAAEQGQRQGQGKDQRQGQSQDQDQGQGQAQNPRGYRPEPFIEQLYYAVDVGNAEVQRKLLHSAALAMIGEDYSEADIKSAFAELLTGVHNKLTLHHGELQPRTKEYSDRIAAIFRQRTIVQLCRHAARFLEELVQQAGREGRDQRDQEMKRIIDLIQRNYNENIKLESLAAVFNYNSAYLGKMFKNTTGEYFNTYLDKVRIDKAKDFLKQGMKVYQVAEKVGYTNVDYFHSKFKKYVGTSPSNYRKKKLDL